jgi:hypothetical protein
MDQPPTHTSTFSQTHQPFSLPPALLNPPTTALVPCMRYCAPKRITRNTAALSTKTIDRTDLHHDIVQLLAARHRHRGERCVVLQLGADLGPHALGRAHLLGEQRQEGLLRALGGGDLMMMMDFTV